jgi:diguanylate cyclase (GGDEF)-like protein/PAS domain S-box-containing protein
VNPKASFRIIVIDDNLAIHSDFMKILTTTTTPMLDDLSSELFGKQSETLLLPHFEIDTASQGQEGVERIKAAIEKGQPYSLAFVDIRMPPGWDGVETIKHIWEIDKDIQVVICTAYSDYSWEETIAELGQTDNLLILKKPFDNVSVRQLACALTKKWQLIQSARMYTDNLKKQIAVKTQSLQSSLSLVKATLESSGEGILVVNNDGEIIDYNQKFLDMWKIPEDKLRHLQLLEVLSTVKDQLKEPAELYNRLNELQGNHQETSIEIIQFNDERIFECYSQPHKLNEQTVGRVLDFRDITKRAKLEQELQYQATHDFLTGLPNRTYLIDCLQELIKTSLQKKEQTPFALLFLDLDRFKLINDSLSHATGDALLQAASARLTATISSKDILVRLGGDEFIIVLTNASDLTAQIQKILNAFQQPFQLGLRNMIVTSSIGACLFPKDGKTVDELLRNADAAMYRAKSLLGNNFQFYTPDMSMQNIHKLDAEVELRHALANDEFFLVYSPQLDLESEKLVAVEALLRWQHPNKGILLPIDFIPLAEETGLIVPLGEWMIRQACRQNREWQNAGISNIRIAVNIAAKQLQQQNITQVIKEILDETGLKPEYLELELTENVIINNASIVNTISELKNLGVTIVMDDFGTGYSNLSYLQKVPLDRLRIDRSFIQQIGSENDDEIIIRAVIAMAKSLHLEVLAEGVETKNQLEFLQKYDGGNVQGFYFGSPLTLNEIENLFKNPTSIKKMTTQITVSKSK